MERAPAVLALSVDAPGARDLDDAFWVSRLPDGGFSLTVCIADVAGHVAQGSPDDLAAASRGLSTYGDGPRSAMFGDHVAARLASLDPRTVRAAVVQALSFSPGGDLLSVQARLAPVRSVAALAYPSFDDILLTEDARLRPMCEDAVDLASALWTRRVAAVGLPDWDSAFRPDGGIRGGIPLGLVGQTVVHEFMVASNAAAARALRSAGVPMIYRNQGPRQGGPGGRYEVVCHGHAGLAEAAYGQFSCPIRRFVDLVNQRQYRAHILGVPAPYSNVELSAICASANVSAQRADALARVKAQQPDGDQRNGVSLERLDPFAFRRVVRRTGGLDRRTLYEFVRRMDGGMLTHSDAAWLLFGRDAPSDDALRAEILARVAASPGEIDRIWRIARDDHGVPPFDAEAARDGRGWHAAAAVGRYVGEASAATAAAARDLALVRLAASALCLDPTPAPGPASRTIRFSDTRAPRQLASLCRLMGWEGPDYRIEEAPAPTERGRPCRGYVEIGTDTFPYRSPTAFGSQRGAVELAAAELAYSALLPYAEEVLRRDARAYGVDLEALEADERADGPVSALDDFCRRYAARQNWVWLRERPSVRRFICALEVSAGGNTVRLSGWGRSREDAMRSAAASAISVLTGRNAAPEPVEAAPEEALAPAP